MPSPRIWSTWCSPAWGRARAGTFRSVMDIPGASSWPWLSPRRTSSCQNSAATSPTSRSWPSA
eukprot:7630629-Pyramimonas_sp.AAC.1